MRKKTNKGTTSEAATVTNETADSARGDAPTFEPAEIGGPAFSVDELLGAGTKGKGLPPNPAALMDQIFGPRDTRTAAEILTALEADCRAQGHNAFMSTVHRVLVETNGRDLSHRAAIATGLVALAGQYENPASNDPRTLYALIDAGHILLAGCLSDVDQIMVSTAAEAIRIVKRLTDEKEARALAGIEGQGIGQG